MENLILPTKIEIKEGESPNEGILTVEPCHHGYGTMLGNSLRRVLLSSLPGAAVTAVKIKGVQHEFSTIPNVKEDVLEIILNLKLLRLKIYSDETLRLKLNVKGIKDVKAKDISAPADIEIANPDLHIATLTSKDAELDMEIFVNRGRGYVPTEEREKTGAEIGVIAVDALYNPVRNVGFRVEPVRLGQITNYDRLILTVETDGSVSPLESIVQSVKVLLDYHNLILNELVVKAEEEKAKLEATRAKKEAKEKKAKEAKPKKEVKEKKIKKIKKEAKKKK
jgi:DNA-directed RNA polymerase subunit alpha